jgi:hypothetical protein
MSTPSLPTASFWLRPSSSAAFDGTIQKLASEFMTPIFDPHVTLHCTFVDTQLSKLDAALENLKIDYGSDGPLSLKVLSISHSPVRFKTLFLEFEDNASLKDLHGSLAKSLPSPYTFLPHLSLLYRGDLPEVDRERLKRELIGAFVGKTFVFNSVALVSPGPGRPNFDDVRAWEVIHDVKL